jgi:hypothetical protein
MHCRKSRIVPRVHILWLLAGVLSISLAPLIFSQLVAQDPAPQIHALGGAPTQQQDTTSGGAGSASSLPAEPGIREILSQRIDVSFQEAPLADVLQYLRDALNVQIVTKSGPLEASGVSLDVPVTLELKSVRANLALELILSAASGDLLSYHTRDNLIIITSKDDLTNTLTTRIYDVRTLNAAGADAAMGAGGGSSLAGAGMSNMMSGGMSGGMRGGMDSRSMMGMGGMRGGGSSQQMELPVSENPLVEIVASMIEPQSWEVSGGPGAIRSFNGLLIVRQSDRIHSQIEDLLNEMRSAYAVAAQ